MASRRKISIERQSEIYSQIKPIAAKYRKEFISENEVIRDTFSILEDMGFFVVRFPSKDNDLSGFQMVKSGINCIYINTGHDLGRQYFSAWHEYYHAKTGRGMGISYLHDAEYDELEYEADCFAGCILLPDNLVNQYIAEKNINLNYLSHKNVIEMYSYFRVSYSAIITRLKQMYPQYTNINKLYGITWPSQEARFLDKVLKYGGDLTLLNPTNDLSINQTFFDNLSFNLNHNRISEAKANSIFNLLNKIEEDVE